MVKVFPAGHRGNEAGGRGGGRGGGSFGGRGGGRGGRGGGRGGGGGGGRFQDFGPPASVVPTGNVLHPSQEYVVCRNIIPDRVPIFNRPVYLENKTKVGCIDEVFGPINEFVFILINLYIYIEFLIK